MRRRLRGARGLKLALLVLAVLVWAADEWRSRREAPGPGAAVDRASDESGVVERAWEQRASGLVVSFEGQVDRLLSDDTRGSRHQRFIVELPSGHTVLVAHNIDLAERVPLGRGDPVEVRGEYEWNDRGGVVHWTHDDPQRRHPGGWIRHGGREYR